MKQRYTVELIIGKRRTAEVELGQGRKVPTKQPKRARFWLTDDSSTRLRPQERHHVWAYDCVMDRTHDGHPWKLLTAIDAYTRECLALVVVREWLREVEGQTVHIAPGSPWKNGYSESSHGKLRNELLNREIYYPLWEAQILIESWRNVYNRVRPHGALRYRPSAPEVMLASPTVSIGLA